MRLSDRVRIENSILSALETISIEAGELSEYDALHDIKRDASGRFAKKSDSSPNLADRLKAVFKVREQQRKDANTKMADSLVDLSFDAAIGALKNGKQAAKEAIHKSSSSAIEYAKKKSKTAGNALEMLKDVTVAAVEDAFNAAVSGLDKSLSNSDLAREIIGKDTFSGEMVRARLRKMSENMSGTRSGIEELEAVAEEKTKRLVSEVDKKYEAKKKEIDMADPEQSYKWQADREAERLAVTRKVREETSEATSKALKELMAEVGSDLGRIGWGIAWGGFENTVEAIGGSKDIITAHWKVGGVDFKNARRGWGKWVENGLEKMGNIGVNESRKSKVAKREPLGSKIAETIDNFVNKLALPPAPEHEQKFDIKRHVENQKVKESEIKRRKEVQERVKKQEAERKKREAEQAKKRATEEQKKEARAQEIRRKIEEQKKREAIFEMEYEKRYGHPPLGNSTRLPINEGK
jgi:hypothetical protein